MRWLLVFCKLIQPFGAIVLLCCVCRYLQEKDVFEKYYKQHLAKRLLSGRTVSDGECLRQRRTKPWHAHHMLRCCALLLQQGRVTALQRYVHLLNARFIMLLVSAAPSPNRFACDASRHVPAAYSSICLRPLLPHQLQLLLAHTPGHLRICCPADAQCNMLVEDSCLLSH
jgi:hypothetical protein